MNKQEFIANLRKKLTGLPRQELESRLNFYKELIDDRIEEGVSEKEAVAAIGSVEKVASQIKEDFSITTMQNKKIKQTRQLKAWEIVLLVLGSPIWLSLLIAAFAVVISVYAVLWSLIISLWAVFASLACCAPCGILVGIIYAFIGNTFFGIALVGTSVICAGLSIFMFFGCLAATRGACLLIKKMASGIKNVFKKEIA